MLPSGQNATHRSTLMNRLLTIPILLSLLLSSCRPLPPPDPVAKDLGDLHVRVVWCQDHGHNDDVFADGPSLRLMGYDSRDGQGERAVLSDLRNINKPMLTPDGRQIVFTDFPAKKAYVVNWDGSGLKHFADGQVLEAWKDPVSGTQWVYVQSGRHKGKKFDRNPVYRHSLDNLEKKELVWDQSPVSRDNFQLSADGKWAGGQFPWPKSGIIRLDEKKLDKRPKGCWTSFAPDNSYVLWIFEGSHRAVTMHAADEARPWEVPINTAPAMNGSEVYHPRWSNHRRYFAVTGPYVIRRGGNNIRGGGPGVEIFLGRFDERLTRVEAWTQVTRNQRADIFPDVWIGEDVKRSDGGPVGPATSAQLTDKPPSPSSKNRIEVLARVTEVTATPTVKSIAPYHHALVFHVYDITKTVAGKPEEGTILVARWAIVNDRIVREAPAIGDTHALTLEPFKDHPKLKSERQIIAVDNVLAPKYYEINDKLAPRGK